jgi:hypothetical protein
VISLKGHSTEKNESLKKDKNVTRHHNGNAKETKVKHKKKKKYNNKNNILSRE